MDEQTPHQSRSSFRRAWKAFLSISLVVVMVIVASLIGVGGAALFIYRQMGNSVTVTRTPPSKDHIAASGPTDDAPRPLLTPVQTEDSAPRHSAVPTVAESTEWHFAEFSDQPRYIDVTYDGGKQHARLKVNTVLSSKPTNDEVFPPSPSSVSDGNGEDGDGKIPLSDPGSHYIVDKTTGRVVGVDGSAGAAMEVRRAQAVVPAPAGSTIRNPVPEVRVASPVMQYGRPLFDSDRPVQAAIPTSTHVPIRKAQPVNPDETEDSDGFNAASELADDGLSVQSAVPVYRPSVNTRPEEFSDRTSVFRRN